MGRSPRSALMKFSARSRASATGSPCRDSVISDADAVLMAQPLPSNRMRSSLPLSSTTTSSLMESPQVGFSCAMALGTWSSRAAPRGER